jgi:hypothetical protein
MQSDKSWPPPRMQFAMGLAGQSVYIFGGCNDRAQVLNDLWIGQLIPDSTKDIQNMNIFFYLLESTTVSPSVRRAHAGATAQNMFFVFGGLDASNGALSDFWKFNPRLSTWTLIIPVPADTGGPSPTGRYHHSLTLVGAQDSLYMFGGILGSGSATNELWMHDTVLTVWSRIMPMFPGALWPPERFSMASAQYTFSVSPDIARVYLNFADSSLGIAALPQTRNQSVFLSPGDTPVAISALNQAQNRALAITGLDTLSFLVVWGGFETALTDDMFLFDTLTNAWTFLAGYRVRVNWQACRRGFQLAIMGDLFMQHGGLYMATQFGQPNFLQV